MGAKIHLKSEGMFATCSELKYWIDWILDFEPIRARFECSAPLVKLLNASSLRYY